MLSVWKLYFLYKLFSDYLYKQLFESCFIFLILLVFYVFFVKKNCDINWFLLLFKYLNKFDLEYSSKFLFLKFLRQKFCQETLFFCNFYQILQKKKFVNKEKFFKNFGIIFYFLSFYFALLFRLFLLFFIMLWRIFSKISFFL